MLFDEAKILGDGGSVVEGKVVTVKGRNKCLATSAKQGFMTSISLKLLCYFYSRMGGRISYISRAGDLCVSVVAQASVLSCFLSPVAVMRCSGGCWLCIRQMRFDWGNSKGDTLCINRKLCNYFFFLPWPFKSLFIWMYQDTPKAGT
jgi:hypothetical protein